MPDTRRLRLNMPISLPLVSVVVTNRNYGRYIGEAVASALGQTYPRIECIVVDDASEDGSGDILDEIAAAHPQVAIVRRPENGGQAAACAAGFHASRGAFVVFLDADDALTPEFVAAHVFVHLSARTHVGLSSSDIVQVADGGAVLCTGQALNDRLAAAGSDRDRRVRPAGPPAFLWPDGRPEAQLLDDLVHVPAGQTAWCWSPMSANLFRRDALALFVDAPEFARYRLGADAFLCVAVGHRCGGFLIDRPLSIYRIHGANTGTRHPQLAGVRNVPPSAELTAAVVPDLIEFYTRECLSTAPTFWSAEQFRRSLERLDAHLAAEGIRDSLDDALRRHDASLRQAIGASALDRWRKRRSLRRFRRRWFRFRR